MQTAYIFSLDYPDFVDHAPEESAAKSTDRKPLLNKHVPRSPAGSTVECHEGTLPALSVMNKLHQQPYDGSRVYNVEIMGYDECFEV